MHWAFIILFAITALRQIPQYVLTFKHRSEGGSVKNSHERIIFVLYIFIWAVALYFSYIENVSAAWVAVGLALLLIAIAMRFSALFMLRRLYSRKIVLRHDHHLVTGGIYSIVRHPLMLSLIIELLGMAAYVQSLMLLIPVALFAYVAVAYSKDDDTQLEKRFGAEFAVYRERVPFMNIVKGIVMRIVSRARVF